MEVLKHLDSPWRNNSYHAYQELSQGKIFSFVQGKVSFISSYLQPTQKINDDYLTDSEYST